MKLSKEQIAINRLLCGNTAHSCKADYIQLAIKALEKQNPKKPRKWEGNIKANICPGCDFAVYECDNYCSECGQALEWGIE